jgi:hypothetical protein
MRPGVLTAMRSRLTSPLRRTKRAKTGPVAALFHLAAVGIEDAVVEVSSGS